MRIVFSAIFLDQASKEALLRAITPKHERAFAEHVTLAFRPTEAMLSALAPHLGQTVEFTVTGQAADECGQAVTVVVPEELRVDPAQPHHLTVSCRNGTAPKYSKELLSRQPTEPLHLVLRGEVRHFMGN